MRLIIIIIIIIIECKLWNNVGNLKSFNDYDGFTMAVIVVAEILYYTAQTYFFAEEVELQFFLCIVVPCGVIHSETWIARNKYWAELNPCVRK